jgi:hypothetical protein
MDPSGHVNVMDDGGSPSITWQEAILQTEEGYIIEVQFSRIETYEYTVVVTDWITVPGIAPFSSKIPSEPTDFLEPVSVPTNLPLEQPELALECNYWSPGMIELNAYSNPTIGVTPGIQRLEKETVINALEVCATDYGAPTINIYDAGGHAAYKKEGSDWVVPVKQFLIEDFKDFVRLIWGVIKSSILGRVY